MISWIFSKSWFYSQKDHEYTFLGVFFVEIFITSILVVTLPIAIFNIIKKIKVNIINWIHSTPWIYSQKKQEYTFGGAFFVAISITLVLAVGLIITILSLIERIDTEIRAEFTVKEFSFTANRDVQLNSIKFQSLTVNNFSKITLYPLPAEKNDPRFDSAGKMSKMDITPEGESFASVFVKNINDEHCGKYMLPTLTFPKGNEERLYEYFLFVTSFLKKLEQKTCGKLRSFRIYKGTRITLETDPLNYLDKGKFNILLNRKLSEEPIPVVNVSFKEAFLLSAEMSQIRLDDTEISTEEDYLKLLLSKRKRYIKIAGQVNNLDEQPDNLELRTLFFPKGLFSIFLDKSIPIVTPKIFTNDETTAGFIESESSLVTEGEISYTNYPDIKPLSFKESDIIEFGKGGNFKLERIRFNPITGIEIRLRGTPTKLIINNNDRRLTYYEDLKENEFWEITFKYIAWAIPIIIGIMGLILIA